MVHDALGPFRFEAGQPLPSGAARVHRVGVPRGKVLSVSCVFHTPESNPLPAPGASAAQVVELGESRGGSFAPVVGFGLRDCGSTPDAVHLVPWAAAAGTEHFGPHARAGTSYEFRIALDPAGRRMTIRCCGQGDDEWFLLADAEPLPEAMPAVREVRVKQEPGARGVTDLVLSEEALPPEEPVPPHPRAKPDTAGRQDAGYRMQSVRSTWRRPGGHVVVSRDQKRWQGFADVVHAGGQRLIVTYCDGRSHGGGGKRGLLRVSDDLGRSWGPERVTVEANGANERLQRLRDGSLLHIGGERSPIVEFRRSTDRGESWQAIGSFDVRAFGLTTHYAISHVVECSDGSWLAVGSDSFPIGEQPFDHAHRFQIRERLQVYRSADRGATWSLHSLIDSYPSSGHAGSEASIIELRGGRLVIYARDSRNDGYPGFRIFSDDGGATWSEPEDLPIPVTGRVGADLLSDGRVMLTTRVGMGLPCLWAWIEDPYVRVGHRTSGVHFNDRRSAGLGGGSLVIDGDGRRGQFTRYLLRPPDGPGCRFDIEAELMVVENHGSAATISVPFAGKLEIFTDHVRFVGSEATTVPVSPGTFHEYRIVSDGASITLSVDGNTALQTRALDARLWKNDWSPAAISTLLFGFGNYPEPDVYPSKATATTVMRAEQISPAVTGRSLWRSFRARVTEANGRSRETDWDAASGEFPDQYQLDHVVHVEASATGWDQGYSGWVELPDGRLFVVNYSDDGAPAWPATGPRSHCPWIRGTWLMPADLPRRDAGKS